MDWTGSGVAARLVRARAESEKRACADKAAQAVHNGGRIFDVTAKAVTHKDGARVLLSQLKAMAAGKAMRRGTVKQGGSSVQAGRAGTACRAPTAIRAVCFDLSEESVGAEDQAQRQSGDCDFSESAYDERAKTLLTHVAYIGAQADACEREQKGPARKIREAGKLVF